MGIQSTAGVVWVGLLTSWGVIFLSCRQQIYIRRIPQESIHLLGIRGIRMRRDVCVCDDPHLLLIALILLLIVADLIIIIIVVVVAFPHALHRTQPDS